MVVCNAAVTPVFAELQDTTDDIWVKVMKTNPISVWRMSTAAENHLARQWAAQWGLKNIRVNTIASGGTRTDMIRNHDPAMIARTLERTPLRRMGEPGDVAAIAPFFAFDASRHRPGHSACDVGAHAAKPGIVRRTVGDPVDTG